MKQFLLLAGVFTALLCSCSPTPTTSQPPLPSEPMEATTQTLMPAIATKTEIPAYMTPLDWIIEQPFATVPDSTEIAMVISGLEEGFEYMGVEEDNPTLDSGHTVQMATIRYDRSVGGQVANEDMIAVIIITSDNQEDRTESLHMLFPEESTWSFWEEAEHQVVRIKADTIDCRLWISGAYLVIVINRLETSEIGPWLEYFVPLYMELYPPN